MIAFCAWLIEQELFQVIELSYLPVGHTHCNVDIPFGMMKTYLRNKNIRTFEEFLAALPQMLKVTTTLFTRWAYQNVIKVSKLFFLI